METVVSEPLLTIGRPRAAGESGSGFAYRVLRNNIMRLRLEPGSLLNEGLLTAELGVSRTPVREGMLRLKGERLVEVNPHKSSCVSRIDFILVHEGFFARSAVERFLFRTLAGRLDSATLDVLRENLERQERALERDDGLCDFFALDAEFHAALYRAAGMKHIWDSVIGITTHYDRLRYFGALHGGARPRPIGCEHRELFEFLRNGGAAGTADALIEKRLSGFMDLRSFLSTGYKRYFRDLEL